MRIVPDLYILLADPAFFPIDILTIYYYDRLHGKERFMTEDNMEELDEGTRNFLKKTRQFFWRDNPITNPQPSKQFPTIVKTSQKKRKTLRKKKKECTKQTPLTSKQTDQQ